MGGLEYMESLPLVKDVPSVDTPRFCPPLSAGRAGCFPLTGIPLPAKLSGVAGQHGSGTPSNALTFAPA